MERSQKNRISILFDRDHLKVTLSVFILIFCEFFFFRNIIFNDRMMGDLGDGRLTMLLAEHWFDSICGRDSLLDLKMFYPLKDTLGFTDMFLGFGIIHSVFRFFGLSIYASYKITIILFHFLGTFSLFYLLSKKLNVRAEYALICVCAWSFSVTYATQLIHPQNSAISLSIVFAIFAYSFFENFNDKKARIKYGLISIVVYMLILYTAWYTAFFTALFTLFFLIAFLFVSSYRNKDAFNRIKVFFTTLKGEIFIYICPAILLMIPFAFCEYKAMEAFGSGASFDQIISFYMPDILDVFYVSGTGSIQGKLLSKLYLDTRSITYEVAQGYNLILILLMLFAVYRYFRIEREKRNICISSLLITVMVSILSCVRLTTNNVSLWWIVFYLVPGAKAVRAISRFLFFICPAFATVTALMLDRSVGSDKKDAKDRKDKADLKTIILLTVLFIFVFIFNIKSDGISSGYTSAECTAFLNEVPAPPEDTEAFYITSDNKKSDIEDVILQMDAFLIADHYDIMTINGYAGKPPLGWGDIERPFDKGYEEAALKWLKDHDIKGAYRYDKPTKEWIKITY